MKRLLPLVLGLIGLTGPVLGQNPLGSVRGRVVDTAANQPLTQATISVITLKDSSLVSYTLSNKQGGFELKALDTGDYRIIISFQGFQSFSKNFSIAKNKKIADLGEIRMDKEYKALGEVIVKDDAPIKIKNDTVEFKGNAFKTKPNATVEDLLKKVPGVQVDNDGTVKTQGEQVQKVYVDGKEFFGTDPKVATKNLTADMVESVQVFDDMSEQAKFTKIDDGSKQKAINIKLKKDKRKGYFGKISVGAGSDGAYEGTLSLNHFNGDEQLSLLANANNVNKQGFSFSDIVTAMGGFQNMSGSSAVAPNGMQMTNTKGGNFSGLIASNSASGGVGRFFATGVNYNNYTIPKLKIGGNYFFSNSKTTTEKDIFRQTFFQNDSTSELSEKNLSNAINQNHRFNIRLEYHIDSMNSLLCTSALTIQHSEAASDDTTSTNAITPSLKYLAVTGAIKNINDRNGLNLTTNFLFRHRFKKIGRTITAGWSNMYSQSDGDGIYISGNTFYNPDSSIHHEFDQNRNILQETYTYNNVVSSSYTEPIGKNTLLELNYAYTNNQNTSDKTAYEYDAGSGKYTILNLGLSNYFKNLFEANRFGANFRVQKKRYNYQLGTAVQYATLESRSYLATVDEDSISRSKYKNYFPTVNFNYQVNRTRSLRFRYNGRTNQPGLSQLQDVLDQSNPLQWRIGNPALKQEFNHNLNVGYNSFDILTFKFIAANLSFNTTSNKIVNSTDSVAQGIQIIKPVNLDGGFSSSSFVTFGLPFKQLRGSSLNFTNSITYGKDISLLYKQKNIGTTITVSQGVGTNFNLLHENLDLGVNINVSYYNVRYSVNTSLNENYLTQTYSADVSYRFFQSIILSTDFDYYMNSGRSEGFNQNFPLWNASLGTQLFKKKNAEFRISVNDLLNQNQSLARVSSDNYIEDVKTNVMGRYYMISFLLNLNKMGGKNASPTPPVRMPRIMERGVKNLRFVH
jgi:hypothetical protein